MEREIKQEMKERVGVELREALSGFTSGGFG